MALIRNPATLAVLFVVLLFIIPSFTSAATGGRVGGSLFRSSSSTSRRSTTKSWSTDYSTRENHAPPKTHHYHHHSSPSYYYTPRSDWSDDSSCTAGGGDASWTCWLGINVVKAVIGFVILMVVLALVASFTDCCKKRSEEFVDDLAKLSVIKLQVGLMGEAQSLQRELNRITESTDTSTAEGLNSVLTGATIALLDNLEHCISSYSSVVRKSEVSDAEACFSRFSEEEADKFDDVTLVNLNSFKTRSNNQSPDDAIDKEYIVVTILVATDGAVKLPTINGTRDLRKSLHTLGGISASKIMAVEVLWTPQQENDTLTERELLKGYPELRGFYEAPSEGQDEDQQPFLGAKVD